MQQYATATTLKRLSRTIHCASISAVPIAAVSHGKTFRSQLKVIL